MDAKFIEYWLINLQYNNHTDTDTVPDPVMDSVSDSKV